MVVSPKDHAGGLNKRSKDAHELVHEDSDYRNLPYV